MKKTLRPVASAGLLTLMIGFAPVAQAQTTPGTGSPGVEAVQHIDRMISILTQIESLIDRINARNAAYNSGAGSGAGTGTENGAGANSEQSGQAETPQPAPANP